MITIRKAEERGHANRGWLNSYYTISFAEYYDPAHMGFRALRVINDDRVAPGKGFGPHAHRDMEIITYVLDGRLQHHDSTGEEHILSPNEIQTMSAGNGIVHSEFNPSNTEPVHFIQIWIEPEAEDLKPSYQQIVFRPDEKRGRFRLLAAPERNLQGVTFINQDARLYVAEVGVNENVRQRLMPGRYAWLQVARGQVEVNGIVLKEGDGLAVSEEEALSVTGSGSESAEVLYFDLR
jgi:redox-sensitive bicupin YhaK (pirin superfamily)